MPAIAERLPARHKPKRTGPRIGLLGGSFNPAHSGHRHISVEALHRLKLDQVWWLVAPQNPLKPEANMASLADRVRHARNIAHHPRIKVTDIEAELRSRHTIDTVTLLQRRFPQTRLVWLMGADNMVQLPRWRRWSHILNTLPVALLARASYDSKALSGPAAGRFRRARLAAHRGPALADMAPPAWIFLHLRRDPASATEIRARGAWPKS